MTTGSPWFRPTNDPQNEPPNHPTNTPAPEPIPAAPYAPTDPYAPVDPYAPADAYAPAADPYAPAAEPYAPAAEPYASAEPYTYEAPPAAPYEAAAQESPYAPPYDPYETEEPPGPSPSETMALQAVELPSGPGRAERRRAAKGGRGRNRGGAGPETPTTTPPQGRPLSRVEARQAARAAKDSVGVVASRAVGELFITFGVVMLLFVTYQLWWTNVLAGQETDQAKEQIEDTWAKGDSKPDAFEPGEGFAIMYIPKLDVVVPVAEGINKTKVLDKGMVGHYAEGKLKTAMPSDKQGNFAVAGHRNTHGEPFRYINRLEPGDPIVVETQDAYYTYEMASILPQTAPSNISVIDPVPKGSGFTEPGRFITLTTCTPEFTSTYRMIVWGRLVEERPRSKGKPKALVG
ncbi:class E sortase [Streptomyces exfoliatus]|uniref:class E sortase n=1 Tax=Streptomyces exfoliatus TaxID=1905 RepID=UPI0004CA4A0E|nr:class E sortase [Streptomyces exfoliatus]